jgi:hypothetical protein
MEARQYLIQKPGQQSTTNGKVLRAELWSEFWPNCGRTLKVTASIWLSSRRSSCASFLRFGTFGRILIVGAGNKKVRSLFASDRTYGFFVL